MTTLESLIARYKLLTPTEGRVDNSDEEDSNLILWLQDGARQINARIGTTTQKAVNITLVANQSEYELPSEWRRVNQLIPASGSQNIGYGNTQQILGVPVLGYPPFGILPNGQDITASMDVIERMDRSLADRAITNGWRLYAGKLLIEFQFTPGTIIRVEGEVRNANVDDVPVEYQDDLVTYARVRSIEWQVHALSGTAATDGTGTQARSIGQLQALRNTLLAAWRSTIAGIEGEI